MTQDNLGATFRALGERESSTARLEQAVDTLRAALQERTRESTPLQWAETQSNLGAAFRALGERAKQPQLKKALVATNAAHELYTAAGIVRYSADLADRIKALNAEIAALEGR
jgi:hypothetical protein